MEDNVIIQELRFNVVPRFILNLTGIIRAGYDLENVRVPMLHVVEEPEVRRLPAEPHITEDQINIVEMTEDHVTWDFDISGTGIGIGGGSIQSGRRSIPPRYKYKMRHEFVSEALGMISTDRKLSSEFPEEDDGDDDLTPDFLWMDIEGAYHAIEVATTRNDNEAALLRDYQAKLIKYRPPLMVRALRDKVITLTIIVVSQSLILSSVPLPRWLEAELCMRMRMGVALEIKGKSQGISFESETGTHITDVIEEMIRNEISKIDSYVRKDNVLAIDSQYMADCLTDPDESEVASIYVRGLKQSLREAIRSSKDFGVSEIGPHLERMSANGRSTRVKPIINLPLFIPQSTQSNIDIPDMYLYSDDFVVETKLWSLALNKALSGLIVQEENLSAIELEALETGTSNLEKMQAERKKLRKTYHRVSIKKYLNGRDLMEVQLQGLWAKKVRDNPLIKGKREESQKPLHWMVDTHDIEEFLNDSQELLNKTESIPEYDAMILDLIDESNIHIENKKNGAELARKWSSTKLYQALNVMSDIGFELAIANKQNCKTGEGIIKKLRYFNCYILIFPTKSSEHMFFTLYSPIAEVLTGLPFRQLYRMEDGGYVSTLVSVKQSKLENWCTAPSMLLSLVAFWSWFYDMPEGEDGPEGFKKHPEAYKMLLFCLLVRLEDKASTEEVLTLSRYMYMEVLKGLVTPIGSNPFKILAKFPTNTRSRLTIYSQHLLIRTFHIMSQKIPRRADQPDIEMKDGEDALPKDTWIGLINYVTGTEVSSLSKLVNLMYIGYLKNKNESPEGNTDFHLIEKTVEEELKFDLSQVSKSRGQCSSDDPPKGKQFSMNCIKHGCLVMEKKMRNTLGQNWKTLLTSEILTNLSNSTTEFISSLKASSSMEHSDHPKAATFKDSKSAMRVKVIEAVVKKLERFKLNPFTNLLQFIKDIENTSGGVMADLFKKQQHGGLREIYVLTIESRVVQLFIEVISRTICSYFEEETLTHPKNKLRKINEHRKMSAQITNRRDCLSMDLCSSSDKTRWNQNFVMTAMVIPLLRMTDDLLHPSIMRILNLWSNKLIKIPTSVTNNMLNGIVLKSPIYSKMKDLFWAPDGTGLLFETMHQSSVRLKTGMMQGILHYTSSLLHLCFLNSSSKMVLATLSSLFPKYKFTITQICSSDDSATILSLFGPPEEKLAKNSFIYACCLSSLLLESLTKTCLYYCMIESQKSVIAVPDYIEFNSEFMFQNTIAMPVIKFIAASLNLSESESFLSRFYTQYNLISDLFSSGITSDHVHLCQISQAILHYKSMGAGVNPLFKNYSKLLKNWPDPKYGFFVMDTDLAPGCLGFSFGHWMLATKTNILSVAIKQLNSEAWITTPDGGIMQSLTIKHGDSIRWKRLADTVTGDINLQEELTTKPVLMFRKPENSKEVHIKLALMASSPGAAKSMTRGNPFLQSISMSVYAINTHCFSKTTVTQEIVAGVPVRSKMYDKVCIYGELKRRANKLEPVDFTADQDYATRLMMAFPNSDRYEQMMNLVRSMHNAQLVRCHRFRHRKTEIVVQPSTSRLPLTILQCVAYQWFGIPVKASYRIVSYCYNVYKRTVPWIRDTISETLINSPFETFQELYNFLSSSVNKTRTFRRTGPVIYTKRLLGQMYNLIRKSRRPLFILKEKEQEKAAAEFKDLIGKVNLILGIPEKLVRRNMLVDVLKKSVPIAPRLEDVAMLTRREATLAYIQGVLQGRFNLSEIASHMKMHGQGVHISYVKEQERRIGANGKVEWVGRGIAYLFLEGSQVRLDFTDNILTCIYTDDITKLRGNLITMNQTMKELKLTTMGESGSTVGLLARYNGTHLASSLMVGTPVKMLSAKMIVQFDPATLVLEVGYKHMKFVQHVNASTKYVVRGRQELDDSRFRLAMLKYHTSVTDVIPSQGANKPDMWVAWATQSACNPSEMFSRVKFALQNDMKPLLAWLKETLQLRLKFKSFGFLRLSDYNITSDMAYINEPEGFSEDDDWILKLRDEVNQLAISGEIKILSSGVIRTVDSSDSSEEDSDDEVHQRRIEEERIEQEASVEGLGPSVLVMEGALGPLEHIDRMALLELAKLGFDQPIPMWAEYIKNWGEKLEDEAASIDQPDITSFFALHPLWDCVIQGFVSEGRNFWHDILNGIIPIGMEAPAKQFMLLLDIKHREAGEGEKTMTQLFMEASTDKEKYRKEYAIKMGKTELEPMPGPSGYRPPKRTEPEPMPGPSGYKPPKKAPNRAPDSDNQQSSEDESAPPETILRDNQQVHEVELATEALELINPSGSESTISDLTSTQSVVKTPAKIWKRAETGRDDDTLLMEPHSSKLYEEEESIIYVVPPQTEYVEEESVIEDHEDSCDSEEIDIDKCLDDLGFF